MPSASEAMIAIVDFAPVPMSVTPTNTCAVPSELIRMVAAPRPGRKGAAEGHSDAMLFRTGRCAGLVPFFAPADALRAFDNALFQVIGGICELAFRFLRAIAQEHIEWIQPQFERDLIEKRRKAE